MAETCPILALDVSSGGKDLDEPANDKGANIYNISWSFHGHSMVISWSFHGHESFHALLYLCKNDVLHCTPQKITICKCINYMQLCQDMSSANSTVLEAGALGIAPANTASLPAPTGDSVVRTRDPCISWLKLSLGIQPHLSGTGCNSRAYTRQNRQKKST